MTIDPRYTLWSVNSRTKSIFGDRSFYLQRQTNYSCLLKYLVNFRDGRSILGGSQKMTVFVNLLTELGLLKDPSENRI